MRPRPELPAEIDDYRDERWRRQGTRQIETVFDAERFIEQVGFTACLTDSRRPGPSFYVAVCGRRDAVMPRHVQKDPEASLTWQLKDELVRRGKVYYGKLARGKAHVPRAANGPVLSRRLGRAAIGREAATESERAGGLERCFAGNGK